MEKRNRDPFTHKIGYRHAYTEGTDDSLRHDESCQSQPIVITDENEEDGGKQAVDRIGFQIVRAGGDDLRIF